MHPYFRRSAYAWLASVALALGAVCYVQRDQAWAWRPVGLAAYTVAIAAYTVENHRCRRARSESSEGLRGVRLQLSAVLVFAVVGLVCYVLDVETGVLAALGLGVGHLFNLLIDVREHRSAEGRIRHPLEL